MTTHYTFIDLNSGFVWGSACGATPAEAALALDAGEGLDYDPDRWYEEVSVSEINGQTGYAVYPGPLPDDADGQDEALIAAVAARTDRPVHLLRREDRLQREFEEAT